ncbi:HD-GYP domain-containing protein [Thiolapillus brandeum]|uniref:Two-component system response regulator n=1 Tax=Thiolapillus brandeum TaxID=1076588 RepID=A0A7U6GKM1_9GAMM|nr:HD domain-containing phosphohydrolase [Thiolapillus brandeum]BAO45390.1 two-component system response regulator [Thiolapillus brandeum]
MKNFLAEKLHRYILRRRSSDCDSLRCAQEKILYGMLGISWIVLIVPYVLGVVLGARAGLWMVVVVDTLVYSLLLYLVLKPSLSYHARVYGVLGVIQFLALALLLITGSQGAGWLWLLFTPVLASLLLSSRNGYLVVASNIGFLLLIAAIDVLFVPGWAAFLRVGPALFAIMVGNYLAISVILVFMIGRLLSSLEDTIEAVQRGAGELQLTQEVTVDTMASLAEYRDIETGNHIIRTRHYVAALARQLQQQSSRHAAILDDSAIDLLSQSAPLHDIGKIGVPDEILLKPGKLTAEEFEEMKKHTVYGKDALMHAGDKLGSNHFLQLAAEVAWTHHEKWDGSGYPRGLSGENIPLSGRIMAVADVYDALISRRVYKEAYTHREALAYIGEQSGRMFDPDVVKALNTVADDFVLIAQKFSDQ